MVQVERYRPFISGAGATPISHLLFADDCLLDSTAMVDDCGAFKRVLLTYYRMLGQLVNLD